MGKEIYYICYPNENLLEAKQLNKEIKALKGETRFIEYGEYDECVNPIKDILKEPLKINTNLKINKEG